MTGWRPALLIAWRDALRHRGRSILVLVMIALPVMAVTAAAVVLKTSDVDGVEGADRVMGAGEALIRTDGPGRVVQAPDPDRQGFSYRGTPGGDELTEARVRQVLGSGTRVLPMHRGWSGIRVGDRVVDVSVTGVDLGDPLAAPLFELGQGRLPAAPHEVVVNEALVAEGLSLGDELELEGGPATIVGTGRDATVRDSPVVLGPIAAFAPPEGGTRTLLVDSAPVSWAEVLELNQLGAIVSSRAVLADPPDLADTAEQMGVDTGQDEMMAVVTLIVVMALLEVVLLAGPAFAVGARRQARSLALMAASGGTPAQARRVVLAGGVVLGMMSATSGAVLGVALGWAVLPLVQRFDGSWFGPFEVPPGWVAAIAAFGLLSAVLAAVVPAWIASRQDVVAVLAGRRGDRQPDARTPVLGLVLLGVGIGGSSYGAVTSDSGNGALWIGASAVVSVLGMIMVVPVVVTALARLAGRLPLTARYAVRDAARHRTRTVPAVAAVAATVAGVVALGIANASDELENERNYRPEQAMGTGRISWWPSVLPGEDLPVAQDVWDRMESTVHGTAPDVRVTPVVALPESLPDGGYTSWWFEAPGRGDTALVQGYSSVFPASVLVGTDSSAAGVPSGTDRGEIDAALAAGRAVVFSSEPVGADEVLVRRETSDRNGEPVDRAEHTLPALFVDVGAEAAPAQALLPPVLAERLDVEPTTAGLLLEGGLTEEVETRIAESVHGITADSGVYVERGYVRPDDAFIVLLVLGVLGGVLMLGGTLTATFLALSDARPDLATLSAVGASPRTRRGIAASYALVVGFVGALLGAGVGLIPGVAVSRPLTSMGEGGPYLDLPWTLIVVLVVALPLLTAAVVGVTARARLPLVARLD